MASAKVAIKGSLLGTDIEPDLSLQSKATFERNARTDEETGEDFLTEDDFVNAIAPSTENYVRCTSRSEIWRCKLTFLGHSIK